MSFEVMWTEKYRPLHLDEFIGHNEIISRLKGFIQSKSLPNLLFAGPPGTGKTSAVLALARDLFGEDNVDANILELNASDERGIDVIRTTVRQFAQIVPIDAPFKIIVLDEADALTSSAQHALRRTMEKYVSSTRFVLLCNYPSKIIEPIQSRCAYFRFNRLSNDEIEEFVLGIIKKENLEYDKTGVQSIIELSNGDLRKAANILQAVSATGGIITEKAVLDIIGSIRGEELLKLVELALNNEFEKSIQILQDLLYVRGVSSDELIRGIYKELPHLNMPGMEKLELVKLLAEVDYRISEGASPDIQISAILAHLGTISD